MQRWVWVRIGTRKQKQGIGHPPVSLLMHAPFDLARVVQVVDDMSPCWQVPRSAKRRCGDSSADAVEQTARREG